MAYIIPAGASIFLNHSPGYVIPMGAEILFPLDSGGPATNEQGKTPWVTIPWGELAHKDGGIKTGWLPKRAINKTAGSRWSKLQARQSLRSNGWKEIGVKDRARRIAFEEFSQHYGKSIESGWLYLRGKDRKKKLPWGSLYSFDQDYSVFYLHPPRQYRSQSILFDSPTNRDVNKFDFPWLNPPAKDRFHETVWGPQYYKEICERKYEPPIGTGIVLNHDKPMSQVGDKDHIDFWFDKLTYDRRCKWREPSGWRDAYFYTPPKPIPAGIKKGYYYVLNTALLTRISDGKPIDILGLTISSNVDTWCWSMSATVKSKDAIDTAFPSGTMAEIEASINGHKWILQTERWTKGEAFVGRSGNKTINGRSLSANLSQPFGPSISIAETSDRTAEQLAQLALDEAALAGVSGWTINWGDFIDWLVPGGAWAVAERTPIEIIQEIVRAGHGFIQTHQQTKTILVKPRYKLMPWLWALATPDVIIPKSMIISIDTDYEQKVQYNAAFVSGSNNNGISAKVTRAGTAGDVAPSMFTSALITDTDAALAKGSGMIAESGSWETGRIVFQLMPLNTQPGLILPGTIIRVEPEAGTSLMCQAIGTSANANRTRGNGVVVRQTVDIEIYHGA